MQAHLQPAAGSICELDAIVVGAGFSGMYMVHKLRSMGLTVRAFERGSGVGGTWFWNRYPGARCDVESMEYSYQFSEALQQEWVWTERYAGQPEILNYANHVADRFDLRKDIQFDTRVSAATFDEHSNRWTVTTDDGKRYVAPYLVMASGVLSIANQPRFKGQDGYTGKIYHTGAWPHEGVDFSGQRVAVIGTGSSAVQAIPHIAAQAAHLTVFQRTPNFSVPARNHPLTEEERSDIKARYPEFRKANAMTAFGANFRYSTASALAASPEERRRVYEERWVAGGLPFLAGFADLLFDPAANRTAAEFIGEKIREVVKDPQTAELLTPNNGVVGCKRLCSDTDYFETFNRPNVKLVDVAKQNIEEITAKGVNVGGKEYEVDAIVFATGFDAMTGALLAVDIRGTGGRALRDKWSAGPRTYLGISTAEFPNLFIINGPGSPSVLTNMLPSIEQHVNFITDTIAHMRKQNVARIEAELDAENQWVEVVNGIANATLYPSCNSWYLGANVPGKPRVFMPYLGFDTYVQKCEDVVAKGYEGFALSGSGAEARL
ncbi:MAG: flavin-containing monooxygenase [Panacagrimonas sp.]